MRVLLFFLLFFNIVYGIEFKRFIVITPQMGIEKIIYILEHVKDHTVLRFRSGYYDFHYNRIMLNNKDCIAIEGVEGTTFNNLSLQITNGNNIRINHLRFENGDIRVLNNNNLLFKDFRFEEANIRIDNSQVNFYKVISQRDYNKKLVIHNSNVNIGHSVILDNSSTVVEAVSSNIALFQNRLGLVKFIMSNLRVLENKFVYNNDLHTYFLTAIHSTMDAIGNEFLNNYGGFLIIDSKVHLERNFFRNIVYFADIEDNSEANLLENKTNNAKLVVKNSKIKKDRTLLLADLYALRTVFDRFRFDIDYDSLKKVNDGY